MYDEDGAVVSDHYLVVYTEETRRIFVVLSYEHGNFVLTKECAGKECGCIGCVTLEQVMILEGVEYPIVDLERAEGLETNLVAYPFTEHGAFFLYGIDRKRYKDYKGRVTLSKLDETYGVPEALLIVKNEEDGTFKHSYVSDSVDRRIIARGCKAVKCPCIGCRIVSMYYTDGLGRIFPAVDTSIRRASEYGELLLPIFRGEEIISKLLNRDPQICHEFLPNFFESPIERMFYELAFLDLHIFPQHQVGKYTLDFSIPDKRIAIELDGHEYHKTKDQRTHDARRDRWLFGQGWTVLRFTGTEIYQNLDKCIDEICTLAGVERLNG